MRRGRQGQGTPEGTGSACRGGLLLILCTPLLALPGSRASSTSGDGVVAKGDRQLGDAPVRQVASTTRCSDAFLQAAADGNEAVLANCLARESLSCTDSQGDTPLHYAAEYDQYNITLRLLAAGALNTADVLGRTPLHLAAAGGHVSMVDLLLDAGAYAEAGDSAGRTPLLLAARRGFTAVVRLLLDRGASILSSDSNGDTALHLTARSDALLNTTQLLSARGAGLEAQNVVGFRPLHFACRENQLGTTTFLLSQGADLYAMDAAGMVPMVYASNTTITDAVINWVLRPQIYAPPDPSLMKMAQQTGGSMMGLPAWLAALGAVFAAGCAISLPIACFLRRCTRSRMPYHVHGGDEAIEEFMGDVFEYVVLTQGAQEKVFMDFDAEAAHTLKDVHRPKN